MNECRRCGRRYSLDDKFCGFCGFNLAAQDTTDMATKLALKSSQLYFELGLKYYNNGHYEKAISAFEKLLSSDPGDHRATELLQSARHALSLSVEKSKQ